MKPTQLVLVLALTAGGCAEDELERGARSAETVQLATRDPGSACRALAAVEVRSGRDDAPTSDQLREYAAERGANYVVIDTFRVYDETEQSEVLTRARLFACPAAARLAVD